MGLAPVPSPSGDWFKYLGLIVLATGVFSFCGMYTLMGINTCAIKESAAADEPH
jgi:hypothetical protein